MDAIGTRVLGAGLVAWLTCLPAIGAAQSAGTWFVGGGVGPGWFDPQTYPHSNRKRTFALEAHGGLHLVRHWAIRAQLGHFLNNNPTGPVQVVHLALGPQREWHTRRTMIVAWLGGGAHWLHQGPNEGDIRPELEIGVGAGHRIHGRLWIALQLQYQRLFIHSPAPQWLVPFTLGLELR
jgi:hypothetical protein